MQDIGPIQAVRAYYTPLIGSVIWPIDSCHFQWSWMTFKVIRLLQDLSNAVRLCNISRGFNWHGASRGPSAIAELLVALGVTTRGGQKVLQLHTLINKMVKINYLLCEDNQVLFSSKLLKKMMIASVCMTSSWRHCKCFVHASKFQILNSIQL